MSTEAVGIDIRVRYAETDQMASVYHANYFVWFEVARTEFLRATGASYRDLEDGDLMIPVVEASCRYLQPARYDDMLRVEARCQRVRRAQFRFDYRLLRPADGAVLAEGWTLHAVTDRRGVPRRLPPNVVRQLFPDAAPPEGAE